MSLSLLSVRDFALIRSLDLEFDAGLNILTGETGAGKSILIGALGLVLGNRADLSTIRTNSQQAEVTANFDLSNNPDAQQWLANNELSADEKECLLRRIIYREKTSKAWVNGRPVTITMLKQLGNTLIDIHGQHEHQSLLKRDAQLQILDDYATSHSQLAQLQSVYQQWVETTQRYQTLKNSADDAQSRIDYLSYQAKELKEADITNDEIRDIEAEHKRLAHGHELMNGLQSLVDALYESDDNSVTQTLGKQLRQIEPLQEFEPHIKGVVELLSTAENQLTEAANTCRNLLDRLDLDPERLQFIENRLGTITDLARKHKLEPEQLPGLLLDLTRELDELNNSEHHLEDLEQQSQQLSIQYDQLAKELHQLRTSAATEISRQVTAQLEALSLAGSELSIDVVYDPEQHRGPRGQDKVNFLVTTNPGQPLKPLNKVASGGELSRISLAIQTITAGTTRVPTLVFDEVDVGIGGGVAEVVGHKLASLATSHQIFCITHLAQVASQGDHHYRVVKNQDLLNSEIAIGLLDEDERIEEVARMLGGIDITDRSREHAKEMLDMTGT